MLIVHPNSKIYLYNKTTDMRKSFNALAIIITEQIGTDPTDGSLYVFCNKVQDKLKILQWEQNGFWLYYKSLAKGKFSIPAKEDSDLIINNRELLYLLDVKSVAATKMF
jgi:transposase